MYIYKFCSVFISFERSVFTFQFLNDRIHNYVLFEQNWYIFFSFWGNERRKKNVSHLGGVWSILLVPKGIFRTGRYAGSMPILITVNINVTKLLEPITNGLWKLGARFAVTERSMLHVFSQTCSNGIDILLTKSRNIFFASRSLKTREKYISFAPLVLLSLYIFWGTCVYFSIFEW